MLMTAVYLAALPSRPLRNLPSLANIIKLRGRLLDLERTLSGSHAAQHLEYVSRRRERVDMMESDRIGYFVRNEERLLAASTVQVRLRLGPSLGLRFIEVHKGL